MNWSGVVGDGRKGGREIGGTNNLVGGSTVGGGGLLAAPSIKYLRRCRFFVLDPGGLPRFRFPVPLHVAAEDAGWSCPSDAFAAALGEAVCRLQNGAEA
jgi:hypothetical protein